MSPVAANSNGRLTRTILVIEATPVHAAHGELRISVSTIRTDCRAVRVSSPMEERTVKELACFCGAVTVVVHGAPKVICEAFSPPHIVSLIGVFILSLFYLSPDYWGPIHCKWDMEQGCDLTNEQGAH